MRLLRRPLAVIALAALAGCQVSTAVDSGATRVEPRRTCDSGSGLPDIQLGGSGTATYCEERALGELRTGGDPAFTARNGDVSAQGAERGTVNLTAFVYANAATEERAQEIVAQVVIHTVNEDYYASGPDEQDGENWGISFDAQMPRRSGLRARSINGDLALSGVTGRILFETANGSAALSDLGGSLQGSASNGDVTVALGGGYWDGSGVDVDATNGDVAFQAPDGYAAHFILHSTNGSTGSDYPGGSGTLDSPTQSSFEQTLGSGGATLKGETVNGDAWVRKRS